MILFSSQGYWLKWEWFSRVRHDYTHLVSKGFWQPPRVLSSEPAIYHNGSKPVIEAVCALMQFLWLWAYLGLIDIWWKINLTESLHKLFTWPRETITSYGNSLIHLGRRCMHTKARKSLLLKLWVINPWTSIPQCILLHDLESSDYCSVREECKDRKVGVEILTDVFL